MGEIAKCLSQC